MTLKAPTSGDFAPRATQTVTQRAAAPVPLSEVVTRSFVPVPAPTPARITTTTAPQIITRAPAPVPLSVNPTTITTREPDMSLLGNIGNAVKKAAGQVSQVANAASFIPGVGMALAPVTIASNAISRLVPATSPVKVPVPRNYAPTAPSQQAGMGGSVAGGIIGEVAGQLINRYAPAGNNGGGSCGCSGNAGRDSCTHQKLSHQKAPTADFFGGCCPPGRVLRRKPFARDICIKKPKMNPFNPRALARADARVTTFARRAAPMLKDLGFQVSHKRHPTIGKMRKGKKHHASR